MISLQEQVANRLVQGLKTAVDSRWELPADWIEKNFYIPEPKDPVTGEILPEGPIRLADHQRRIINEALSKRSDGMFRYVTVVYSAPKKSGKSALAAAVCMYLADQMPYSNLYCLANKGKQAEDRLYIPIRDCIKFHKKYNGRFQNLTAYIGNVEFSNGSLIQAIPCNAEGEAGAEPTGVFISEAWGFNTEARKRLYTEMTVPPTKFGRAIRWIESYAGFVGESEILERLYNVGVKEGEPHPDFLDLKGADGEPVVYVNHKAKMFVYWETYPRMVWQNQEYYEQQANDLDPQEFRRVHGNEWVSPVGAYVQEEWWKACADYDLPELTHPKIPVIVAVDAATEGDCAALVAVTRYAEAPETDVAIRACRIFRPSRNKPIILSETVGKTLQEWGKKWNLVCIAYDSFQMKKLVQDYKRGIVEVSPELRAQLTPEELDAYIKETSRAIQRWYYEFSQHSPRSEADKMLKDMIISQQIHYNPTMPGIGLPESSLYDDTLEKHVCRAGSKSDGGKLRLTKLTENFKIDAAVALSMAVAQCMKLNVGNSEGTQKALAKQLSTGEITYEQYLALIRHIGW